MVILWFLSLALTQTPPPLPFPDNPDPTQWGIPVVWGQKQLAVLDGRYGGKMVQLVVFFTILTHGKQ